MPSAADLFMRNVRLISLLSSLYQSTTLGIAAQRSHRLPVDASFNASLAAHFEQTSPNPEKPLRDGDSAGRGTYW